MFAVHFKSVTILSFLFVFTALVATKADTNAAQPPPPHLRYEEPEAAPFLEAGSPPMLEPQGNAAIAEMADWSKIVFQTFRDRNWEIYLAKGDGSNQTRLTNHSASDIEPGLNRGCTRIAFASNRTGNFEIFTMNPDGSSLKQLTFHDGSDGQPAWSPDGSRIAFRSYRDGQGEVYVMNADGSEKTRLTNHGEYDGQPAWSPDGTKIAFVSNRTGGYRVWVMNADGNGQTQLSSQPYSANPAWSPDGSQIAYDSDGDDDGWQELWLMNADGSHQRAIHDPGGSADAWARSWSPDGRYVAFTRISWIYYRGKWYWTAAYLDAWDSASGGTIRLSSQGMDWLPDWHTTDAQAPESHVEALPPYTRGELEVRWRGGDTGGSELKSYDVQYRETSDDSWTDWQVGTTETNATFPGTAGSTLCFRSRARDNAHNLERWPLGDGDTCTTLYTWAVSGTTRDNRGIPMAGVTIRTTPLAFKAPLSDNDGQYAAYVAEIVSRYAVRWLRSAYGDLPSVHFVASSDAYFDVILPPTDNVVRNGGFESDSVEPETWQPGGTVRPMLTAEAKHTGNYGVRLGWTPEFAVNVSQSNGESDNPQLLTDDQGIIHLVWSDHSLYHHAYGVFYTQRGIDGIWSTPQDITSKSIWGDYHPQLAVDSDGIVHVVFHGRDVSVVYDEVYYARRESDGTWSSPRNISNSFLVSEYPQLAVDASGVVHVAWAEGTTSTAGDEIYYTQRDSDGTWSNPKNISNNSTESEYPQLAVERDGIVHVVWEDSESATDRVYYAWRGLDGTWTMPLEIFYGCGSYCLPTLSVRETGVIHLIWHGRDGIYYAGRGSDGIWSDPLKISGAIGAGYPPWQLAVEGNEVIHVVWPYGYQNSEVYYVRRGSGGIWSDPENVSNNPGDSVMPQLAADGNGIVHLVWYDDTAGDYDVYYRWRASDGTWSNLQNILGHPYPSSYVSTSIAVDVNGTTHVVWSDSTPENTDIYYAAPPRIERIGDSLLFQTLTTPMTLSNPTLSFLYQVAGASPTANTWFGVQVDDGVTATTLVSIAVDSDTWTHRWFDFTPWASQTVTLTFVARQPPDQPRIGVYLDEVTLGSAFSDLWVDAESVAALLGEQAVHTISYGNRGGVVASSVRVTASLPSMLSFVDASPTPIATTPVLVWDAGDLTAGDGLYSILVTATVAPAAVPFSIYTTTVRIGAVSPEIERENNLAHIQTFIGRRTYLPIVMKRYSDW